MKTCEICSQAKDDVMTCTDPYDAGYAGESFLIDLCDNCFNERIEDIR